MRGRGLTLVETLVALFVFILLLGAMLALLRDTLAANSLARKQALLVEEARNALGYLGEKAQEAQTLLVPGFSATPQGSATAFTCTTPACVGLLLPQGTGCQLRVWRAVPRGQVPAGEKEPDPWADANTKAVLEYRLDTSCTAQSAYSRLANVGPLLDYLSNDPFALKSASGTTAVSATDPAVCLEVAVQLRLQQGNRTVTFPPSALNLRVYPRNLGTRAKCAP